MKTIKHLSLVTLGVLAAASAHAGLLGGGIGGGIGGSFGGGLNSVSPRAQVAQDRQAAADAARQQKQLATGAASQEKQIATDAARKAAPQVGTTPSPLHASGSAQGDVTLDRGTPAANDAPAPKH